MAQSKFKPYKHEIVCRSKAIRQARRPGQDIDARTRLLSASTSALVTPSSRRSTIGDRAFFVVAPRVWNSLPSSVTASQTLGTFRRRLKTHLFAVSFT